MPRIKFNVVYESSTGRRYGQGIWFDESLMQNQEKVMNAVEDFVVESLRMIDAKEFMQGVPSKMKEITGDTIH